MAIHLVFSFINESILLSPIICQIFFIAKEIFLFTIFFILYWDTLFQIARLFWTVVSLKKLPIRLNVFFFLTLFHKTNWDMSNTFHITFKKCYKVKNINNSLRVLKKWKETSNATDTVVRTQTSRINSDVDKDVPGAIRYPWIPHNAHEIHTNQVALIWV